MWTSRIEQLAGDRAIKVAIDRASSPLSFAEALRRWQEDADFRSFFIGLLADAPYSAFCWETPPITTASPSESASTSTSTASARNLSISTGRASLAATACSM